MQISYFANQVLACGICHENDYLKMLNFITQNYEKLFNNSNSSSHVIRVKFKFCKAITLSLEKVLPHIESRLYDIFKTF